MKKYIFIFILILVIAIGSSVSADSFFAEISDDKVLMRNTAEDGTVELKSVEIYNLEDYKYFGIRAMTESVGAEVSWDDSTKTVIVKHNDLVISLKSNNSDIFINGNSYNFGYPVIIIDGKAYAPLELYKAFTGELKTTPFNNTQPVATSSEAGEGIVIEHGEGSDRIRLIGAASNLIHEFELANPNRIVLDFSGLNIAGTYSDGETYDKIRHFKGSDGITRIVFDLKDDYEHVINYEGDDLVLTISNNGNFEVNQELVEFRNNSVIINTGNYSGYKISRSTDPFTLIATFPTILIDSPFAIDVDGEFVNSISAQIIDNSTKISIVLNQQCAFELEKLAETFIIGIYEPVVEGVTYHNSQEKQLLTFDYLEKINSSDVITNKSSEINITVNDTSSNIKAGQIYVNDDIIKSVFVTKTNSMATIKITTKSTKFGKFELIDGKLALVLYDNDYSDFLVVISPGHGGSDPGAIVNGVYEAHLNLEISNKLKAELENAGVNIHMLRTDDTFVSLENRTKIANNLGADLFISIHCNTLEDENFDGLMTLVHSGAINYNKINGKTAGTIIHEEVIASTGATDRAVRDRDKIIVLKDTAMPAVEIECGFLTNSSEFDKLLEDSYQWNIAKGTAIGVLKVLDLMD